MVRWVEGQLSPIGGQSQQWVGQPFALRCKRIHGWHGLDGIYRIAYLCEGNLYVDEGGTLTNISPDAAPTDVNYNEGDYNVTLIPA